jgi:FAD/FMN-containing dehydrogenase
MKQALTSGTVGIDAPRSRRPGAGAGAPYTRAVGEGRLASLDRAIDGRVIRPDAPDYDDARRTFNGLIDRRPAAIVRCASDTDVRAVIEAAREDGLPLGVRGGGHSVAGSAIVEAGVVADLGPMRDVTIDPVRRIAHVGGGAQWQDLDGPALRHGLAVPGGVYGDTGVGGLTLGGGIGFLMGIGGLTCDNLIGARVVLADGRVVEAAEDPDLLWALRGGGGNFGVVTRFDLALHPVGAMYGGTVTVPLGDGALLHRYSAMMRDAPDELTPMVVIGRDEEGSVVVDVQFAYIGDPATGERLATHLVGNDEAVRAGFGPCTYIDIQSINEIEPFGSRNYWSSTFVTDLDDALIDLVLESAPSIPTPVSGILIEPMHGAARRRGTDHAAFANRASRFHLSAIATWEDPAFDEAGTAWSRSMTARVVPWSTGGLYVNYSMPGEAVSTRSTDRARAAYPPDVFERLQVVKRRYDPDNLFRGNLNIPPA